VSNWFQAGEAANAKQSVNGRGKAPGFFGQPVNGQGSTKVQPKQQAPTVPFQNEVTREIDQMLHSGPESWKEAWDQDKVIASDLIKQASTRTLTSQAP